MVVRKSLLARQPLKTIYTIYFVATTIARLSFLSFYYIPRSLRPKKTWSWKAAVGTEGLRLFFAYATAVQLEHLVSLEPGKEGERFVTIHPRPDQENIYTGVLQSDIIKPEVLGGTWYPRSYSSHSSTDVNNKVVLHFHGGAFVLFDSREATCGNGIRILSQQFDHVPVFCPEYRLATAPTGQWPAPLQDAVTSYRYLLDELKIDASRIIISGDSAGATLVLALLRYIGTASSVANALPLPAAALLWSPWVNACDTEEANRGKNKGVDYVERGILQWGQQSLTDNETIISASDPYISPLQGPFHVPIPLWVEVGTAEVFYDSVQSFVEKMRAMGNTVRLYEIPDAVHNSLLASVTTGFQDELREALREVWKMIKNNAW